MRLGSGVMLCAGFAYFWSAAMKLGRDGGLDEWHNFATSAVSGAIGLFGVCWYMAASPST